MTEYVNGSQGHSREELEDLCHVVAVVVISRKAEVWHPSTVATQQEAIAPYQIPNNGVCVCVQLL